MKVNYNNVYINGYFLTEVNKSGVYRFAYQMLIALDQELSNLNYQVYLLLPYKLNDAPELSVIKYKVGGFFKNKYLWEQIDLPKIVGKNFLINLANFAPIFKTNQVCVIHDILPFKYPQEYSTKFRIATYVIYTMIVKTSKYIATVSKFSAKEIIENIGKTKNKILVLGNSAKHLTKIDADLKILRNKALEEKQYILAVFSQKKSSYKNVLNYLAAIKDINFKFVCVGDVNIFNLPTNVINLGKVNDVELKALYQNAQALVIPSVYEGFGVSALEAMSCSCPVLASDIPVFREIYDNAVIYFDPLSINDIKDKIKYFINNVAEFSNMSVLGLEKSNQFIWNDYAHQILRLINNDKP